MPGIDPDRLLADLRFLRGIGARCRGVVRPAFSAADMEARRWLKKRFEEAGLESTIDGVGNVLGRSRHPGKALLVGSHSDTQPTGGWLDGALGVIYGLEVVRALAADSAARALAVDTVSYQGVRLAGALREAGLSDVPRLRHAPGKWQHMPSGAFHDAGFISASLPSAMLFIPSIGGISHDFAEDSRDDDIVLGCQVLADAAASILAAANAQ